MRPTPRGVLCCVIACLAYATAQSWRPRTDGVGNNGRRGVGPRTALRSQSERNDSSQECASLETLDFLHFNKSDPQEIEILLHEWPCEVRNYWNSNRIQCFASIVQFLFKYMTIFLIIIGLLVNVYSLFVLNTPPINKSNISVYLKALAISDIGALIFNVGVGVLRARFEWISNFYTSNMVMCYLHKFLLPVFFHYSTWLTVTFTFERLQMIRNPLENRTWKNEKPAKLIVMILAILILCMALFTSITIQGFENDNTYGYKPCRANEQPKISIYLIPVLVINNIIPTILITSANICLLILVRRSAKSQISLNVLDDQSNADKITRLVITLSITYLILFLPLGISSCAELFYSKNEPSYANESLYVEWKKNVLLLRLIRGLCFFLYLISYVNNFFLYCLSGDIFRQTVKVCLPHCIQKIIPSLVADIERNSQYITRLAPSISVRKTQPASSKSTRSNSTISQMSYHNETFIQSQ